MNIENFICAVNLAQKPAIVAVILIFCCLLLTVLLKSYNFFLSKKMCHYKVAAKQIHYYAVLIFLQVLILPVATLSC